MNNSSVVSQSISGGTSEVASANVSDQIIKTAASVLVMIGSFIGNTLVISVVLQSQRMRTVTNYLIVNMACADILYTLVAMPPLFVMIFGGYNWAMSNRGRGIFFCQVVNFGQYMLVPVSVLTLAAIAFDRFFAILMPLKRIINKRVFNWILAIIWVTSVAVATPMLYSLRVVETNGSLSCNENWAPAFDNETAPKNYALVLFSVVFCLPICVITVLYTVICRHLWYMKPPGETEREASRNLIKRRNSRRKVVKMLITVVVLFIISWLPLQVATFMFFFQQHPDIPEPLYFACEILMRASCALNPAVYAIFSENYRQGFKRVLARCCCSKLSAFIPQRVVSSSSSRQQTVPTVLKSEYALSKRSGFGNKSYQEAGGIDENQI